MKARLLLAALLLVLPACKGDSTGGEPEIVALLLMPDDRTLAVGESLQLTAVVRDDTGEEPAANVLAETTWSSDAPGVATVNGQGVVSGVAPGTANIRAQLEDQTASVLVTVAAAPPPCSNPAAVRSLAVGQSVILGGIAAATVCLDGGAAGKEYVLTPFYAGELQGGFANVSLNAQNIVPIAPVSPSLAPGLRPAAERQPDLDFHARLRERAEDALAPHFAAALAARREDGMAPSLVLNLRNPSVGQQVQVNVGLDPCTTPDLRTARVAAVTQRAVVLADVNNPSGGLTDAEYASFATSFDTLIHPVVTGAVGAPGDVDDNSRVLILYTRAVNELTPRGSSSYVGGYFHPRDLFPAQSQDGLSACSSTNYAEMFYMLVPDPGGAVNGNVFSRDLVLNSSLATVAHEFLHLIAASRRLYVVQTTHWNEETWLNEGWAHTIEELMFYHVANRQPRTNLGLSAVNGSPRTLEAFRTYMDQNFRRYEEFLDDAEGQSPYDDASGDENDLATRGAAWAFVRYALDRRGSGDGPLLRQMIEGSTTGFATVQRAMGADARQWVRDWYASVFVDDVILNLEPRHMQPSWNFRTFWSPFPLASRRMGGPGTMDFVVKSGSGAFIRFGVAPTAVGTISVRSGGGAPLPSAVYTTVIRTR